MRTRLKVGLMAAVIACGAFVAAKAQEEKSYLPPLGFQDKGQTTVPKRAAPQTAQPQRLRTARVHRQARRGAALRHRHYRPMRVAHHRWRHRYRYAYHRGHHRYRYAYYPGYRRYRYAYYRPAFPGFLFGLFSW